MAWRDEDSWIRCEDGGDVMHLDRETGIYFCDDCDEEFDPEEDELTDDWSDI